MQRKQSPESSPKTSQFVRLLNLHSTTSPKAQMSAAAIRFGIKLLEDFGFRTQTTTPAPRLSVLAEFSQRASKPLVHVTDFWSQRQQKEFLIRTGLRQAQYVRERRERKRAFFFEKEKIEGAHMTDQLYERILAENNPMEAAKAYAAGAQGKLLKQMHNQVSANSKRKPQLRKCNSEMALPIPSKFSHISRIKVLLSKCDATIQRNVQSRQEFTRDYTTFLNSKSRRVKRRTQFLSFDLSANPRTAPN